MFVICGRQPSSNRTLSHTFLPLSNFCLSLSFGYGFALLSLSLCPLLPLPLPLLLLQLQLICPIGRRHALSALLRFLLLSCLTLLASTLLPPLPPLPAVLCLFTLRFTSACALCPNLIHKSKRLFCRYQRDDVQYTRYGNGLNTVANGNGNGDSALPLSSL